VECVLAKRCKRARGIEDPKQQMMVPVLLALLRTCWASALQLHMLGASFLPLVIFKPGMQVCRLCSESWKSPLPEGKTAGQFLVLCCFTALAPSDEAETMSSNSFLDSGPGPAGQLEPTCASDTKGAEHSTSPKTAHSPEEASDARDGT